MRTTVWIAALLMLGLGLAGSCGGAPSCVQCGRDECSNLAFVIHLDSGKTVETCCPRCGLRYIEAERPTVASLAVRDFDSAERLDAGSAVYVEGSDVTPCSATREGPPKDERGCCLKPVYDRCLPSLLAFGSKDRAESFAREHGGVVRTFTELKAVSAPTALRRGG